MQARQMPLAELRRACEAATHDYQRRVSIGDDVCFELFRRAICDSDQFAWEAVFQQYRSLVQAWVHMHPVSLTLRQDHDYWANRALERFWTYVGPDRLHSFPNTAALLAYLKICVHGVLQDEIRKQTARPAESLDDQEATSVDPDDVEGGVVGDQAGRELWRVIVAECQDDAEHLVAFHCFVQGLKPRELRERYPERFPAVSDVHRVKRNLLDRLRRSAIIEQFYA